MADRRQCPEGQIWTESFGCMKPIEEGDGITFEELDAIIAAHKEEQEKITTGLPAHSRRKKRGGKGTKESSFETGVRAAVQEAIISTKL